MVPAALFLSPELSACDPREAVSPYGRPSARGSDFFGPHALQSTVGDRVFARALGGRPAQVLGDPDVPHTVTYIDDFGKALVNLGEREDALGGVWHVPNAGTVTMRRFVELVFAEVGRPPRLRAAPSWGLVLAGLFNPTLRAVREQLYQSERACWSTTASLNGQTPRILSDFSSCPRAEPDERDERRRARSCRWKRRTSSKLDRASIPDRRRRRTR